MGGTANLYEVRRKDKALVIRFSSSLSKIDQVCQEVTRFLESLGPVLHSHMFAVNLVLREGLTNAVRHGNRMDPDKWVIVSLVMEKRCLHISIEDQGKGFDWKDVCRIPVDEAADHGRGMAIMETYFDRYRYNETGNTLYLEKEI